MKKKILFSLFITMNIGTVCFAQSWVRKADLPLPGSTNGKNSAFCFSINNKIYLGGGGGVGVGGNMKAFYEYDPVTNVWTQKKDVPGVVLDRMNGIGFAINNKGYAGLGFDGPNDGNYKNDLWEYDPTNDSWIQKADFPGSPRCGASCFVVNGKAYVGGGGIAGNISGYNVYDDFYEYNPSSNTWKKKADLLSGPVIFHSAFAIGNYGYFTCGNEGVYNNPSTRLCRYDPVTDTWSQRTSFLGYAREQSVAFALNNIAYVGLGSSGGSEGGTWLKDFYYYNPSTDTWTVDEDFAGNPSGRELASACVAGDSAYVGFGEDLNGSYLDWWRFRPVYPPTLISPGYNAKDVTRKPIFTWGSVTGASTYAIQVSKQSNFSSTVAKDSEITSTSYTASSDLDTNTIYYWRVTAWDGTTCRNSEKWFFTTGANGVSAVDEAIKISSILRLGQNYPNPFSQSTVVSYQLSRNGVFEVRDMLGRVVQHLSIDSTTKQLTIDASALPNGMYLYSLSDGKQIQSRMMMVMK